MGEIQSHKYDNTINTDPEVSYKWGSEVATSSINNEIQSKQPL